MEKEIIFAIGNDHGGLEAKKIICNYLKQNGFGVIDEGTDTPDSCDYPIFAQKVSKDVANNKANFGILICNTGEGMAIAANKIKGIRAGIIYNQETAHLVREHNHANVLTFGAKFFTGEQMCEFINIFLKSKELGDRHQRRVDEINKEDSK